MNPNVNNSKSEEDQLTANSKLAQSGRKICSACGTINDPSSAYCYKCGVELPAKIHAATGVIGNPAGFWIRLGAFVIDQLFLTIVFIVLALVFSDTSLGEIASQSFDPNAPFSWGAFFIGIAIEVAYWTLTVGTWGKTLGKAILRLKVTRVDGSALTYTRSFARYWAYYVSWLTFGLGFIAIALSSQKRGFHDFLCDTRVIKVVG